MAPRTTGPRAEGLAGQYVGTTWYDDIKVIPEDQRAMPFTVPHEIIRDHPFLCKCEPCAVYPADLKRRLKYDRIRD